MILPFPQRSRRSAYSLAAWIAAAALVQGCSPTPQTTMAEPLSSAGAARPRPVAGTAAKDSLSRLLAKTEELKALEELVLPASFSSLASLKDRSLLRLTASGTRIKGLQGAPQSLRILNVSDTEIDSLGSLPGGLQELDIRGTAIRQLTGLPQGLEVLRIDGPIRDLKSLPSGLRSLHLEDAEVRNFAELPRGLRELHLIGPEFDDLEGLPETLRRLTLQGTGVTSLKGLQLPDLVELTLVNNPKLRIESNDLPQRITELKIDSGLGPQDLSALRHLAWLSDLRESPAASLPRSLTSVTFNAYRLSELPVLPPSLLALGLRGANFSLAESLPAGLESLSLTSYRKPDLPRLPASLKRLSLTASLTHLPDLPRRLEELYIRRSAINELGGAPEGLRVLVYCEMLVEKVVGIRERFPKLQRLDLCNSASLKEVGPLPSSLKKLNVSQTSLSQLPVLPAGLEELDISRTKIRLPSLHALPRTLRTLTVGEDQVAHWGGAPPGLRALRLRPVAAAVLSE